MKPQRPILKSPSPVIDNNHPAQIGSSYLDFQSNDARVASAYKMLSETGRLEQIRAQLRRDIFTHLLDSNKSVNAVDIDLMTSTPGRLSLALVAGFVRQHFPATFSVFMAEANLAWLPVDDNEALLLNRLGVPFNSVKKGSSDAAKASALESIVQHLLRLKLNETRVDDDKPKTLTASWQPCSDSKKQPVENAPRSVESILSDMRTLIREELQPKQQQKDAEATPQPRVIQQEEPRQQAVPTLPASGPQAASVPAGVGSGLDESRLHEYIEKMVERMMGSRRSEAAVDVRETEKTDTAPKKQLNESKGAVKKTPAVVKVVEKKTSSTNVSKPNKEKKQLSFHEEPSPTKKKSLSSSAAEHIVAAGSSSLSTMLSLDEIKRQVATLPPVSAAQVERKTSNDMVSDVFELRRRLDSLEQEAEKLESSYHQRLASIDTAQPLANTLHLIDRLNSNRRSLTSSAIPITIPVSSLRSSSSTFTRTAPTNYHRPTSTSYLTGTTPPVPACGLTRRRSPFAIRTSLPASIPVLATLKSTMPPNDDPYHNKEYDQSQRLLTSVPTVDYRRNYRPEANLQSADLHLQSGSLSKQDQPPLPFSVYPSGIQQEIEETMQQIFAENANLPTTNPTSSQEEREEKPRPPVQRQPSAAERKVEVRVLPAARVPSRERADSGDGIHTQPDLPKQPEEPKTLKQSIPQTQPVAQEGPSELPSVSFQSIPASPPREEFSPPAYSVSDASPEMNKFEGGPEVLPHAEESEPQEEVVISTDTRPADEDAAKIQQPVAASSGDQGEDVDDVLKKYMEMVLQKRAAEGSSPQVAPKYDRRNYEEDEDESPQQNRPKVVRGQQNDEAPSTSGDDFWS